jgi:transcription antitermination factor NusG
LERFKPGDRVRVTEGAFNGVSGRVQEVDLLRQTLKVSLNLLGSKKLAFSQVEKL